MIGVGEFAVAVGTDDADVAAALEGWRIDEPAEFVDYALELHPAHPEDRSMPRPLPSLRHGSDVLEAGRDRLALRDGFMRILTGIGQSGSPGRLRILGVPLLVEGGVVLIPSFAAAAIPFRWFEARGVTPLWSHSVVVDPATLEALVDVPLGSTASSEPRSLVAWWVEAFSTFGVSTPATSMVPVLGSLVSRDARELGESFAPTAALVERLPPRYVDPFSVDDLKADLAALIGRAP